MNEGVGGGGRAQPHAAVPTQSVRLAAHDSGRPEPCAAKRTEGPPAEPPLTWRKSIAWTLKNKETEIYSVRASS